MTVARASHTTSFIASDYINDTIKPWKHRESKQMCGFEMGTETLWGVLSTWTSYSSKKLKNKLKQSRSEAHPSALH